MTPTKAIITMVIACILTCTWGFVTMSSASDMDCFNMSVSQEKYKQSITIGEKIKARKSINYWKKFCIVNQ